MVNAPPAPSTVITSSAAHVSAGVPQPGDRVEGPGPGELGIKERRSWHTWQLLAFGLVCLLLGMLVTWSGDSNPTTPKTPTGGVYSLPPPAGVSATSTSAPGSTSA